MPFTGPGNTLRFSIMQYFFWSSVATVEIFFVPFLLDQGYSSVQAGYAMSLAFALSIFTAPMWGFICDHIGQHRLPIRIALIVSALAMAMMPLLSGSFQMILLLVAVFSATANSMPAVLDGWIIRQQNENPAVQYGIARGMGSLGFASMSIALGVVVDHFGSTAIFYVYIGAVTVVLVTIQTIQSQRKPLSNGAQHGSNPARLSLFAALRESTEFLWFVLSATMIIATLRASMTFLPLLVYSVGGTNSHLGLAQAVSAVSELPFIFGAAWLVKRHPPRYILLIAMLVFIARIGAFQFVQTPAHVVMIQLLHGASFGTFIASSVYFVDRVAPVHMKTLFQATAPALYFGVGSVLGSSIGGNIVEFLGLRMLYRLVAFPVMIATVLFFWTVIRPALAIRKIAKES
jgi:PPP family 3-phenylpropionic acid transporter